MSRYCKICCSMQPDDRFSGAGLKTRVCKQCQRLPASERERLQGLADLTGFMDQKNLSAKNVARLKVLAKSQDETVRKKASTLLEVAMVHPHQRKRLSYLRDKNPDLFQAYVEAFNIDPSVEDDPGPEPEDPTNREPSSHDLAEGSTTGEERP